MAYILVDCFRLGLHYFHFLYTCYETAEIKSNVVVVKKLKCSSCAKTAKTYVLRLYINYQLLCTDYYLFIKY